MRKFFVVSLSFMIVAVLFACNGTTIDPDPDPDPDNDDPVETYDPRSLVPERCDYLENIDDWQPVWCDEFDEDGLPNPDLWGYDVGTGIGGWGNLEQQFYTRERLDNVFIEDGILHIQANKEDYQGSQYTSARLTTKYRGDWLYGRVQVKAKMPSGTGLWPAIWMLPTDVVYGTWPASGEIDIMEYVGYDPGIIHGTIHTGAYNHGMNTDIGFSRSLPTVEDEFHLYEMIWEPGKIDLFVDGDRFAQFRYNPDLNVNIANSDAWPFDQRFHLLLNVAVGGTWGGQRGIDDSIFPQAMEVEYVRVYQKDYAGLTEDPPSQVGGVVIQDRTFDSIRFKWDHAEHDVMVKAYNIYVDGVKVGSTTLNAYRVHNLDPNQDYVIGIEAVDFKGQVSPMRNTAATTEPLRTIFGRIQAEDYDAQVGVRVQQTQDEGGGQNVTGIDTNNFIDYILEVPESGTYRIEYRVASADGLGEISLFAGTRFALTVTNVPETGGNQVWTTITSEPFELEAGVFTFRIRASEGGFNLNYFEFIKVDD